MSKNISDDIHTNTNGTTVINGPRGMAFYKLLHLKSAMKIEIESGMQMTSRAKANPWKIAKDYFGIEGRKRDLIYQRFLKLYEEKGEEGMVDMMLDYEKRFSESS